MLFDKVSDYKGRAIENLAPPILNTPVVTGATGSATVEYVATFKTLVGETTPTSAVNITHAPNTLTSGNYVTISINSVTPNAISVRYFKKDGSVYKFLGEQTSLSGSNGVFAAFNDTGQTLQGDVLVPTTNTSGRPQWVMLLWELDRYVQRSELMDIQLIVMNQMKRIGDLTWKNGDVTRNGQEIRVSSNVYSFLELDMYLDGQIVTVPGDTVEITGSGEEKIGIIVTPRTVSYTEDSVLWNPDLPNDYQEVMRGASRLVYDYEWVVDEPGMLVIQTFIDGEPKQVTLSPERTVLDRTLAERDFEVNGNYVVYPFATEVLAHATDADKLTLKINKGNGRVNGYRFQHDGSQEIAFDRGRDTAFQNSGTTSAFSHTGGEAIASIVGPYNVDGLKLLLAAGSGNDHTVTLSGNSQTNIQVCDQIEAAVNAYPNDGTSFPIITAIPMANDGFALQAPAGKTLHIKTIAGHAYTALGLVVDDYVATGQRIYRTNRTYVKDVTDISYLTDTVLQISHNSSLHRDFLVSGANYIYGASNTLADCHDAKYDYVLGIDFIQDETDGNYINFSGMGGAEPVGTYFVKARYRKNAIKSQLVLAEATDVPITKGAEDGQDNLTLTGAASITRVSTGVAISGLSGAVSNVVEILRVNNTTGQSATQYSNHGLLKNSTSLLHATSQLDWSGAGAQGSAPLGQPTTAATYYVSFRFWYVQTAGDIVVADSYDSFEDVESYSVYNLRDCLDFRTSGAMPKDGADTTFDYNYYLSRIDKLFLSDSEGFLILRGSPAVDPPVPNDPAGLFPLKVINITPYTYDQSEVTVTDIAPVRLTQAALQNLSKQIEEIQYREVVNGWEKEVAQSSDATDVAGIFTDALTGYGKLDLQFNKTDADGNNVYHTMALDRSAQTLRLPVDVDTHQMTIDLGASTNVRRVGNMLVLDYDPEVFDSQPYATRSVNAAVDFTYDAYNGSMDMVPSVDVFMDSEQLPQANVDFDNNIQPLIDVANPILANNIAWGSAWVNTNQGWSTGGHGWAAGGVYQTNAGTYQQLLPGRTTVELGDRVVDLSLIGMMRTKKDDGSPFYIQVRARQLMPNQDHAITVNNIPCAFVYDSGATDPRGEAGTHTYQGLATAKTDNTGWITGKFAMPAGVPAGSAIVRVFHYSAPTTSWASSVFSSAGLMQTTQDTTLGMATPVTVLEATSRTRAVTTWSAAWYDPLAQSFLVKDQIEYISELGLFFRTKSTTQPMSFQLREMTNGYPNANILATVTIEPGDITCSDDGSIETVVELEHILGYKPGNEYSLVPIPGKNNTDYELWAAKVGEIDLGTGALVAAPPCNGVLFHSPNARTWIPIEKTYLKYNLYRCNFRNEASLVFNHITGIEASMLVTAIQEFAGPGTAVKWAYSFNGVTWLPYNPMLETDLAAIVTDIYLTCNVTSLGGSYQLVEKVAGIAFLKHQASARSIFINEYFLNELELPNKIVTMVDAEIDSERHITPMATVNDGTHWFELLASPDYTPVSQRNSNFYRYKYESPDVTTVLGASNASPIVITTGDHCWTENMVATFEAVEGNTAANGTWRLKNVTPTTMELVDPLTGADSTGNGQYTTGGTFTFTEFDEIRPRIDGDTDNLVRSPKINKIGYITKKV